MNWAEEQNTTRHTERRIRYFVENGIPKGWNNDYSWQPPVDWTPAAQEKQEPKERVVYRTVTVDSAVLELQKEVREN